MQNQICFFSSSRSLKIENSVKGDLSLTDTQVIVAVNNLDRMMHLSYFLLAEHVQHELDVHK